MDLLTIAKKIADRVEAESFKQNVPSRLPSSTSTATSFRTHRMTGTPALCPFITGV